MPSSFSSSIVSRRLVVKCCKQRGWSIQPSALQGILELAESEDDVEAILDQLVPTMKASRMVTETIWNQLIEAETNPSEGTAKNYGSSSLGRHHGLDANDNNALTSAQEAWTVVNAFETPKLSYEVMRKQFSVDEKRYSLFGTAEDKTNMLSQRYAFIHQRLLRHEFFRHTDLSRTSAQFKIVPIESLLGNANDQPVLLLGLLLQIDEGQWYLEDPSGQVPISFQDLSQVDEFFVTEHSIVVVDGRLYDGTFYVEHVGNPVLEPRETSLSAIRQQLSHPAYSIRPARSNSANASGEMAKESFVFVSDAHLDQPRTLQHLEALFARYEKYAPSQLPIFVIMGNFSSEKENPAPMEELAGLIGTCGNLRRNGRFVLVPGLNDTPGYTLPVANTLSRSGGFSRISHVEWATNPCRIRNRSTGREVVVFRYDLLHLFQRQQLLLKPCAAETMDAEPASQVDIDDTADANKDRRLSSENVDGEPASQEDSDDEEEEDETKGRRGPAAPHVRVINTVLGQGHLIPVSGVPVAWNYDHSLRLYPLPDLLVLGGDGPGSGRFHEVCHEGCHVLHPGSMVDGSFASYGEADSNQKDKKGRPVGPRVEFGQLGVES